MVFHDNSRLGRPFVIALPDCKFLKSKGFIQFTRYSIGLTDFQENRPLDLFQERLKESLGHPSAAKFRSHGYVQNLPFVVRDRPDRQECLNAVVRFGD